MRSETAQADSQVAIATAVQNWTIEVLGAAAISPSRKATATVGHGDSDLADRAHGLWPQNSTGF